MKEIKMKKRVIFTAEDLKKQVGTGSFKLMQLFGKKGLEYYNQGDKEAYNLASKNYLANRRIAKQFGIDVSKYPETLEELTK